MHLSDLGVTRKSTIHNGLPVVVFERPGLPVSIRVPFFSGSQFDPEGKEGLSHFTEHMICSGTKEFPSKPDVALFLERYGALFNAATGLDHMYVLADFGDTEDLSQIMHLFSQLLTASIFDPEVVESERGAIFAEMGEYESSPEKHLRDVWNQLAYQGSPMANNIIGTAESLNRISRDDLISYYQTMYGQERAALVVAGGVTLDQILSALDKESLLHNATPRTDSTLYLPQRAEYIATRRYPGSSQTYFKFGFPAVNESHPDFWPLGLLTRILGQGRTSRLHKKLRLDLGLVYGVRAGIEDYAQAARLSILSSCKQQDITRTLMAMAEVCQELQNSGPTDEELTNSQAYWRKTERLRVQTSASWTDYHMDRILIDPSNTATIVDDLTRIEAVTLEDVRRVAQEYLKPGSWYLAACGDLSEDDLGFFSY